MLTLCVPTKNRAPFVQRLLRYYAGVRAPCRLLIGDASNPEQAAQTREAVERLAGRLDVAYHACPGLSSCATLEALSHAITTPYSAFLGDDDVLCPAGLQRCVEFLEQHPGYAAAHGDAVIFQLEGGGPHGAVGTWQRYPQAVVEAGTATSRLQEFFRQGPHTLLYSVHRTDVWRAMFRGVSALPGTQNSNVFKDELIAVSVAVIRGRVKALDGLYLVHQTHQSYRFPHVFDWLTDPAWYPSYGIFRDRLVEELMAQDGLGAEAARRVVRDVFWGYLAKEVSLTRRQETQQPRAAASAWRARAKRIPGLRRAVQAVRASVRRASDPLSWPALLQPTSPDHADFMPLYRLMTQAPAEAALHG